jgi:enoyl-CoA hydratase/carnithine racemase
VPQMLGYHRAAELLLLGEPFMAEAALEVGLVNRVVPPTEANGIAQSIARKLAAKPLSSLVETKRLRLSVILQKCLPGLRRRLRRSRHRR